MPHFDFEAGLVHEVHSWRQIFSLKTIRIFFFQHFVVLRKKDTIQSLNSLLVICDLLISVCKSAVANSIQSWMNFARHLNRIILFLRFLGKPVDADRKSVLKFMSPNVYSLVNKLKIEYRRFWKAQLLYYWMISKDNIDE